MAKLIKIKSFNKKQKVKRPGRHAKSNSKIKSSKTYKKRYRSQGK
jgi:hypothetical protein